MDDKNFSYENFSLSVAGHLALVALMVTSFAIVVKRAQMVTPDRVEITEIDLSNIKVTREETSLFNTALPTVLEPQKEEVPEEKKPEPVPEPVTDDNLTEMQPSEPVKPEPEPQKKQEEQKAPEKSAVPSKTVVRVNRDVASLNRTMTVSVIDALRVRLTRCWIIDTERPDISEIRAVAHLTMHKNGMIRDVWFESAARAERDPAFAYVLDTIRSALRTCQPFRMLPPAEFDHWERIQLTFYPTQGKIM